MRPILLFCLLSGLTLPFSGHATTIIPFANLGALYLASDEVVLVRAGFPFSTQGDYFLNFDCEFKVLSALKGTMPADTVIALRQYTYDDPWGRFDVVGDFIPKGDYTYLIFLSKIDDGWRPIMLSYYIFEQAPSNGSGDVFVLKPVDESRNIGVFPHPDGKEPEPLRVYEQDALLKLLQQYNTNPGLPWNPGNIQQDLADYPAAMDRVLPTGCDFDQGGGKSRWLNSAINMYYDVTNLPSDAPDRLADVYASLNTEYPGLTLINSGSADFTPDCSDGTVAGNDFITFANNSLSGNQSTLVMFEDPCNQLTNLVGCAGILGIGGGYMLSTTHTFKSETWKNAAWGYVVINNGVRPCLTETNYERLLQHEITHTLKMDHLDAILYPNNNMNPSCCNAINTKDRECMNYVYSSALPVDLVSFNVTQKGEGIDIRWATAQELDNDFFIVEKSADGLQFEPLAIVQASHTTAASYGIRDAQPFSGVNYYRLIQQDLDGTQNHLGMRVIQYSGHALRYVIAPNPVRDNSILLLLGEGVFDFESLELLDLNGRVSPWPWSSTAAGFNRLELGVGNLPAGVYWLRIMEGDRPEMVKFVKQ